ncbi:glycerate kinase [Herbihabitans rhizosphaerae]|uniref:Glycerate kinase n=1 Tax=Herbihabitans rhizosphaerae TaxID=1872711 RepID=A0A4Q7KTU5_9PSEU|nr:glycerate kinase [Herbihabitans rhizosphaerae]
MLIAPDCFGGTLTASEAAAAVASGWRGTAPADRLTLRPLADGGPGFVEVLHTALGGTPHRLAVRGPLGAEVDAVWLEQDGTAYIESAQACGLHLVPAPERRPLEASTAGVGDLIRHAVDSGVRRIVVGLGGSASTDGGSGMLAALGAVAVDDDGEPLSPGGGALAGCARLSGAPGLSGVELTMASDVTNPLLGIHGAATVFAPQKGADEAGVQRLERALTVWADVLATTFGQDVRAESGAGAAGGLGAGLLALGARVESGAGLVRRLTGLDAALDAADLVITGEGSFDWQSLRGKLITAVAEGAAERGLPCLVLAGQVSVGRREAGAVGVESSYSLADHAGSVQAAMADAAGTLAALAADVARAWSDSAGQAS